MSAPMTIIQTSPFSEMLAFKRTSGGQTSVGAMPGSYQVAPRLSGATGDTTWEGQTS
jgi:hypothetical protein